MQIYGNFQGFPETYNALFGLVSYNDPCSTTFSLRHPLRETSEVVKTIAPGAFTPPMPFYGSLNNWYFDVDASHLEDEKRMAIFQDKWASKSRDQLK